MRRRQLVAVAALFPAVLVYGQQSTSSPATTNPWVPKIPDRAGLLHRKTFVSKTLGRPCGYLLYLPPDYEREARKRFPVVYYLHGLGGDPGVARIMVERLDPAIRNGQTPSMIVVSCTDPTRQSCWCDSKDGTYPVETVIVRDLIAHIDSTYRTIAKREGRTIEGFSMGGMGAARLALKYPDRFCAFSVLATAMPTAERLRDWMPDVFRQIAGDDLEYCRANLPWALVEKNADAVRGKMHIRVCAGANDPKRAGCQDFHDRLTALKIEHEFGLLPNAGHNLAEIYANLPGNPFAFYVKAFGQQELATTTSPSS